MDGAVAQWFGQGFVHEPVLLQQRHVGEARARDRDLKVVAAAGAVLDAELGRIGECLLQQHLQRFGRHAAMVAVRIEAVSEATATELALAAYRPRSSQEGALVALLREDLATLRRRGHVTDRPAPLIRTNGGEFLVVLEWSSDHAVGDAHRDPEVLEVWQRKDELAEYISPRELAGSEIPFARYGLVADL